MLSSNMAASIVLNGINIHLCKHKIIFTLLCVTVCPRTSLIMVQAHDGHIRGQHDVSENFALCARDVSARTLFFAPPFPNENR